METCGEFELMALKLTALNLEFESARRGDCGKDVFRVSEAANEIVEREGKTESSDSI